MSNSKHSLCQQENIAYFSFPFSFETFYMSEKESDGSYKAWLICLYVNYIFFKKKTDTENVTIF